MAVEQKGLGDIQRMLSGDTAPTGAQANILSGLAIPRLTTTARDALAAGDRPEGLLIYNTTTHKLNVRVAAAWEVVTSA